MSGEKVNGDELWQDKEIRFDGSSNAKSYQQIHDDRVNRFDKIQGIIESNSSEISFQGVMRITNLRVIWYASSMPRINLSIGYSNITGLQSREVASEDIRWFSR
ncbi:hypothetical protein OSTOST_08131 [Ostertagia ostertagi]